MNHIRSIFLFALVLAACSPATTTRESTISVTNTATPLISSTLAVPSSTVTSVATEVYPTFTPAPTSTAIATLKAGQPLTLSNIHMNDEQKGWGIDVGEHIVHTTDGGYTWRDVTPRNGAYRDSGFFALDSETAWATPYQQACYTEHCAPEPNNATVWHTTDGGNTWRAQHVCLVEEDCGFYFDAVPSYYFPVTLQFVDAQTGWLLVIVEHVMFQDRYVLYQTMDGGTHWSPVLDNISGPMVMSVTGLAFQDNQIGWFASSQIDGATDPMADWSIYQSIDAGHTWNEIQLPAPDPLPKTFANNTVWCGAESVNVIPPNALGVTIQCRVYTKPWSLYDFYFHSTDGGKHWVSWLAAVRRMNGGKHGVSLIAGGDVMFINPLVGWRTSFEIGTGAYDLDKTRDGGQTWQPVKTAVQWNGDLDFVSEQVGWAIATYNNVSTLVHTTDGGKTWQEIKPTDSR